MRFPIVSIAVFSIALGVAVGATQDAASSVAKNAEVDEALLEDCVAKQGANGNTALPEGQLVDRCRRELLAQRQVREKARPAALQLKS